MNGAKSLHGRRVAMNGATKWGNVTNHWPMNGLGHGVPPILFMAKNEGVFISLFFFQTLPSGVVGPLLVTPPIKGYNFMQLMPSVLS